MPKEPLFPTASENTALTNPQFEPLLLADAPVHVHKLDADLYLAEDMEGITESLFGSGNLNYLLLQARQTDAAAAAADFDVADTAFSFAPAGALSALSAAQRAAQDAAGTENALALSAASGTQAAIRAGGMPPLSSTTGSGNSGTAEAGGDGLTTAGQPAPLSAFPHRGTDSPDDKDNDPPPPGDDDDPGNGGEDPGNGGDDGGNAGGGDDDIDILVDNNIGLPVIDINLDPLEDIVGDIDLGIGVGFDPENGLTVTLDTVLLDIPLIDAEINLDIPLLNPVVGSVLEAATPVLDSVTGIVQPLADGLATTAESLIGSLLGAPPPDGQDVDLSVHNDLGLPQIDVNLDVVENIVGDIDIAVDLTHGEDGIGIGLNALFADIPLAEGHIQLDVPLAAGAVNGALDPLAGMLGGVTQPEALAALVDDPLCTLPELAETIAGGAAGLVEGVLSGALDSAGTALGQLGQTDGSAGDYDIALHNNLGLPQIDVNLDMIESLVGDIDIGLSLDLGADGISVGLDTTLAGIQIFDNAEAVLDVPLVTPLAGDILDITQALLGDAACDEGTAAGAMSLIDGITQGAEDTLSALLGGGDEACWPQLDGSLLGGTLEGLGGILNGDDAGSLHLPEPVGNIVEGLGLLPSGSDHGGSLLSGLFNGHGGGLFG
jgi:hypothetical protein